MKKINIFLLLVSFGSLFATILFVFFLFFNKDKVSENIKDFLWFPDNYEKTYKVEIKIDGERRKGIVFKDKFERFFDARATCLSRNMSLPHQGFEILFSEFDEAMDGIFWIDAYNDQNGFIFSSAIGQDGKVVNKLLEESIQASRMLSKNAQKRFNF